MIPRKSGILFATSNCLQSLPLSASKSSTSSPLDHQRGTRQHPCTIRNAKPYATIAEDNGKCTEEPSQAREPEHVWPRPRNGQSHPTPYQIFSLEPNAPYTKARFYELVKIYHPDLTTNSPSSSAQLPHAVKVERYRLIVAAHAILSDPSKRRAYDRFGAGWNGKAESRNNPAWSPSSPQHAPGPFTHSWGEPSDPIWRNATWEDWERFYARRAQENADAAYPPGGRRAPLYMANSWFLALIAALTIVGSSLNYGRAQDAGTYFVEQRDLVHDRAAKELRRVKQEAATLSREGRIEFFVRQREATMGSLSAGEAEALQENRANRVLPDREVCGNGELEEKDG